MKHADAGMSYVYALPLYIAFCDYFVYCDHDHASGQVEALRYQNRAWCRVEQVVGWRASLPPIVPAPQPFERVRLKLFKKSVKTEQAAGDGEGEGEEERKGEESEEGKEEAEGKEGGEGGEDGSESDEDGEADLDADVDVADMDGVRPMFESCPVDAGVPVDHPGDGWMSNEAERASIVVISRLVGYTEAAAAGNEGEGSGRVSPGGGGSGVGVGGARPRVKRRTGLAERVAGGSGGVAGDMDGASSLIDYRMKPSIFQMTEEVCCVTVLCYCVVILFK